MKTKSELQKQLNKLQKEIDNFVEPKQELEVGKWYRINRDGYGDFLIFLHTLENRNESNYGFNINGEWIVGLGTANIKYFVLATKKEIETALIKEAEKRGFKQGAEYLCLSDKKTNKCNQGSFVLGATFSLHFMGGTIFKNGKWAEIIGSSKPTINGYEIEVDGDIIKFGCQKFKINEVKHLSRLLNGGVDWVTSFKIFGNGPSDYYEITVKQLKEVVDYLNK